MIDADQSSKLDAMAERQATWRKELCLLIRMGEATGTEVGLVLAEALAHDLRIMASVNRDLATNCAMVVIQELLSAVNPVQPPPNVTQSWH